MKTTILCFLALGACVGDSSTPDGGGTDATSDGVAPDTGAPDAPVEAEAGPPCDLQKPFSTPQPIAELNTSANNEMGLRLSPDLLTAYFAGDATGQMKLYFATRGSVVAAFGAPQLLANVNDNTASDSDPTVTADGLNLYFATTRAGGPDAINNVMVATRSTIAASFGTPSFVATVDSSGFSTFSPFIRPDNGVLYLSSFGNTSAATDLYSSTGSSGGFGAPQPLTALNTTFYEQNPVLTSDGLTIFFASDRTGTKGGRDVWTATRTSPTATFGAPTAVTELNSAGNDDPDFVSPDGCTMFLTVWTSNKGDLYSATRK